MKKSLGPQTLVYPTPVFVIATYDAAGKPNAMTAAWCGVCNSEPPSVAVSLRKATYTYGCLLARKAFTLNVPSEDQLKMADFMGIASGKDTDKFARTGLTPVSSDRVDAPYIKECPLILECRVIHFFELGLHTQFIGEILDVKAEETVMDRSGLLDMKKVKPFVFAPDTQAYYGIGSFLGRAFSIEQAS
jgi:flavin reductase (DIM6/NTAB) family NADH-FMN oxidoreductase RutF